jgi:hypothetical protein
MKTKMLEIRDRHTYLAVIATKTCGSTALERYHFKRRGYSRNSVMVTRLVDTRTASYPYEWGTCTRTMHVAHKYIEDNFDELTTGDVVDVEYILGETQTKKISEALI